MAGTRVREHVAAVLCGGGEVGVQRPSEEGKEMGGPEKRAPGGDEGRSGIFRPRVARPGRPRPAVHIPGGPAAPLGSAQFAGGALGSPKCTSKLLLGEDPLEGESEGLEPQQTIQ